MSLEYALVTDSSLPVEIMSSDYYVNVEKKQWLDLVDYSESICKEDPSQRILFLIVAKGTPEQEAADAKRREKEAAEAEKLEQERLSIQQGLAERESKAREEAAEAKRKSDEKIALRQKSKSIFNALYRR